MKLKALVCGLAISTLCFAQPISIGDSVRVLSTTEKYLTGEKISKWVYSESHIVSQIGTKNYPNGVLLNIQGANSWLNQNDVIVIGKEKVEPVAIETRKEEVKVQQEEKQHIVVVEPAPIVKEKPLVEEKAIVEERVNTIVEQEPLPQEDLVENTVAVAPKVKERYNVHFQTNGDVALLFRQKTWGAQANVVCGARINPYLFVGGGLGFYGWLSGMNSQDRYALQVPIFANARGYLPIRNKDIAPFIDLSIGGTFGKLQYEQLQNLQSVFYAGLYSRVGLGLDISKCHFCIGYEYGAGHPSYSSDRHLGFVSVGFSIPENK